jgi:hypothetical protein
MFFAREGAAGSGETLLVWNPLKTAWTTVAEDLVSTIIGPTGRTSVYLRKVPAGFTVYLYDADREKTFELGTVDDKSGNEPNVHLSHQHGVEMIDVNRGATAVPALQIRYNAASGRFVALPKAILETKSHAVLYGDEAGNWIIGHEAGVERWNADGSKVRLWPPAP